MHHHRSRRSIAARAVAIALAGGLSAGGLSACGGSDPVTLVEGVSVEIDAIDNSFRPAEVEVAAGTEVVWTNRGRSAHNVLPVEGDSWGADADVFESSDTYQHRFTDPGTYAYYCSLHGATTKGMVGTIVVTG